MEWAILGVAVVAVGLNVTQAIWLHQSGGRERNALDVIDSERKVSAEYKSQRDVEVAAHAVTKDQLAETQRRLVSSEKQRNEAFEAAKEHVIKRIETADIQDAASIVADLLATDLRTGLRIKVPSLRPASTDDTDLEKP